MVIESRNNILSNFIFHLILKRSFKRLSNFLDINNLTYLLQFGFQQSVESSFDCGIFVNLHKEFDTANHKILLLIINLKYYGSMVFVMTASRPTCQIIYILLLSILFNANKLWCTTRFYLRIISLLNLY